ncbi:MAG: hypothetical protein FRX49_02554 [Trebouxia sp. A1-2]|nr:MAG: hypothetical protein FRX49_02554 [Trebouxia sp. A1-2]
MQLRHGRQERADLQDIIREVLWMRGASHDGEASGPATKSTSLSESSSCTFSLSAMQPSTPTTGGLQTQADLLNAWQQHYQDVRHG